MKIYAHCEEKKTQQKSAKRKNVQRKKLNIENAFLP